MREDYLSGEDQHLSEEEKEFDKALRPLSFSDFAGQGKIVDNLQVFVHAARKRSEIPSGSILSPNGVTPKELTNSIIRCFCEMVLLRAS
jgi:Holliday junction DNA helicase RuvB